MNIEMLLENTLAYPIPAWLEKVVNFFAAEDGDSSDKTEENEEDDGFESDWGGDSDEDDDKEDDKDDEDKDKGEDGKKASKSSAIIQKQKYRAELKVAKERIAELEQKRDGGRALTETEKREKDAQEFLAKKIQEELDKRESKREAQERADVDAFTDELEEVLEDNTDISERQILDVCEELEITPLQALKVVRREAALKGKTKPNLPQARRGSGEVKDDKSDKKDEKPKGYDNLNRFIKDRIKKGLL